MSDFSEAVEAAKKNAYAYLVNPGIAHNHYVAALDLLIVMEAALQDNKHYLELEYLDEQLEDEAVERLHKALAACDEFVKKLEGK